MVLMDSQGNGGKRGPRRARGRPRGWEDKTAQNTIKSLDRAMEVFEYLSAAQGRSLTALASETRQAPATVYRILVTLCVVAQKGVKIAHASSPELLF